MMSVRFLNDSCMIYVWLYMISKWFVCHVWLVCVWCLYDLCMMSVGSVNELCMICVWFLYVLYGVCKVFCMICVRFCIRLLYGFCMCFCVVGMMCVCFLSERCVFDFVYCVYDVCKICVWFYIRIVCNFCMSVLSFCTSLEWLLYDVKQISVWFR